MAIGSVATKGGGDYAALSAQIKSAGGKSAPPAAAASGPQDSVDLSPAAQAALQDGYATLIDAAGKPMKLKVDGDRPFISFEERMRHAELMHEHHDRERAFGWRQNDFLRERFGLPKDIDEGGGLMLTGDPIIAAVRKRMAADGDAPPHKSDKLSAADKKAQAGGEAAPAEQPSAAVQGTSMITVFLPGSQGSDSRQIEFWLNNDTLDKLSGMSADEVKKGLLDLTSGSDAAVSGNTAVKDGVFGQFMRENADYHPEFTRPEARYALFDPEKGGGGHPMLMIQTPDEGAYLREHMSDLVDGLMNILGGGGKQTAAST